MKTNIGFKGYSKRCIEAHNSYKQTIAKGKQAIKQLLKQKADSDLIGGTQ